MPQPAVSALAGDLDVESLSAREVVELMLERLHPSVALACSFQKEEAVLVDLLLGAEPKARVFALDTHVLFPETYDVWRAVEKRYGIEVEVYEGPSLGRQAAVHGDALWERNPNLCCAIRKVAPLGSGAVRPRRLDHGRSPRPVGHEGRHAEDRLGRAARAVEGQPAGRLVGRDVWAYVRAPDLPVNPLHERGYASIGCTHCTQPGEGRDGRWAGGDKTECGLHA